MEPPDTTACATPTWWLYSLGERSGITWVLSTRRLGFSKGTTALARSIEPGDLVVIHVGRGAYHNPTRDESQLLGVVRVRTVEERLEPETVAGKEILLTCRYDPILLLPERQGIAFRPIAIRMSFVKQPENWGLYLRSGLRRLSAVDAALISDAFAQLPRQAG